MSQVIKNVITPNDKFLRTVLQNPKSYHIDIYQREYKWTKQQVETLLTDIEVRFNQSKRNETEAEKIQKEVVNSFEPYFLNTFLTNTTADNVSIVDGQQRLTTLLLIFIKFYRIIKSIESEPLYTHKTFALTTISNLIYEMNDFGNPARFKIHNENRELVLNSLIKNEDKFKPKDETQKKIIENYKIVSDYLDKFLRDSKSNLYDVPKVTYYISYLLDKLSLVEIKIERQENVAMIFEVVNDRGLGLKPYEILKGKLIGGLENSSKEKANKIWTDLQDLYFNSEIKNSTEKSIDLDMFFKTFFRAKFADTELEYEKFEGSYHYEVYKNDKVKKYFANFENPDTLYKRVTEDIKYFAELYQYLRTSYDYEHLIYNKLLDQNQQYMLILANIIYDDDKRSEKIKAISKKFDQFHTIIRLLDAYDSNSFQKLIYPITPSVRENDISVAESNFDKSLISFLEENDKIGKEQYSSAKDLFNYKLFESMHNRWTNFTKYILMRVDRELSLILDKPSYASENLEQLEHRFNKNNLKRYGMHLEHVYARNDLNKKLFLDKSGIFDEARFNEVRNRFGAVVLLKDKQNLSSGNDIYKDKFETYKKSNLIWNEILVNQLDDVDKKNLPDKINFNSVPPNEDGLYPLSAVEQRQHTLFQMIKHIWSF